MVWLTPLALYGALILAASIAVAFRNGAASGVVATIIYPTIHSSLGIGFWIGLLRRRKRTYGRSREESVLSRSQGA